MRSHYSLFPAVVAIASLGVLSIPSCRPAYAQDRFNSSKPNAVLIGWEAPLKSTHTQPADFSYDSLRLGTLSFGVTHNIGGRASKSGGYADALYLDVRTSANKTVSGSGFFSQEGDQDFENVKQFVIGLGVQRRVFAHTSSGFRPYAGLGAGIYYINGAVRFYGTDYETLPQTEARSRQTRIPFTYNNEWSDNKVTVGGKLLLGVEHQSGLFLQGDLTFLPDLKVNSGKLDSADIPVSIPETAIGVRVGYRF